MLLGDATQRVDDCVYKGCPLTGECCLHLGWIDEGLERAH